MEKTKYLYCSFCRAHQNQVEEIVTGAEAAICDKCIEHYGKTIKKQPKSEQRSGAESEQNGGISRKSIKKPREINDILERYVIGQEKAKKALSVAVYNHYKRVFSESEKVRFTKSNILFIGPTGTGKTLLIQTLSKTLGVPLAIADATSLTEAGYIGEDVESVLVSLIRAANSDIQKAEKGIVYIDEFDKIAKKSLLYKDVSGEGVQQALLRMIEGAEVNVPKDGGKKHPNREQININTENILFIFGGAFVGLADIVAKRVNGQKNGSREKPQGDITDQDSLLEMVTPHDLFNFGIIPECVGRLPVTINFKSLNKDDLVRILTEPVDSLVNQYQALFEMDGIELEFTHEAIEQIVEKALLQQTGARGLRGIMEDILMDAMYNAPSEDIGKIIVNPGCSKESISLHLIRKQKDDSRNGIQGKDDSRNRLQGKDDSYKRWKENLIEKDVPSTTLD